LDGLRGLTEFNGVGGAAEAKSAIAPGTAESTESTKASMEEQTVFQRFDGAS
jgi:hypothetical protein